MDYKKRYASVFFSVFLLVFSFASGETVAAADTESNAPVQKSDPESVGGSFSVSKDYVCLDVNGTLGTFGIYAVDPETARKTPVIATRNAFSSTFFSLRVDHTAYRLNKFYGIPCRSHQTATGAELIYTVQRTAEVTVDFDLMSSADMNQGPVDMLKVTVRTVNTGTAVNSFALRSVFDTVLGEMSNTDFSTAETKTIQTEKQFSSMNTERWVLSGNGQTSVQFLLYGRDITTPSFVTMANRDILLSADWQVNYVPGRVFNSILSYSNSALDILWKQKLLKPGQSSTIIFYIALAVRSAQPLGDAFLNRMDVYAGNREQQEEKPLIPKSPVEKPAMPPAPVIRQEQLDPEYVRKLIQQINALESDGSGINNEKIQQLSAELDAILAILRNQ